MLYNHKILESDFTEGQNNYAYTFNTTFTQFLQISEVWKLFLLNWIPSLPPIWDFSSLSSEELALYSVLFI